MKAAVYYSAGDIRVENRPNPESKKDNIIAKVLCCCICGTDLKILRVGNPRCTPPRIIGHEMVGEIIHVGEEVNEFKIGDRITLATTVACGECAYCKACRGNVCPNAKPISYDYDGAFAEYIEIPPAAIKGGNVIKVSQECEYEHMALCEPISCAVNAQDIIGINKGDTVVIIGGGPLGMIHAELAKASGAKQIIIAQRSDSRIKLIKERFDYIVLDTKVDDIKEKVFELTQGLGADVVIVSAPAKEAMEQAPNYARKGGRISYFASLPKGASDITLDSRILHYNELIIAGCSDSRPEHVQKAADFIAAGKIDANAIITHRLPIEKIHEGFDLMKNSQSLKVVIYPNGGDNEI